MDPWATVTDCISRAIGLKLTRATSRLVSTGGTAGTAILETTAGRFFVKHASAEREEVFAAEAESLQTIQATGVIRVPTPLCWGHADGMSFLVLEYIDLLEPTEEIQMDLGRRLARMHRVTQPQFGWHRDNTIGATRQINDYAFDWVEFFRERRLRYQLRLAARRGYPQLAERAEPLLAGLAAFFSAYVCEPSLLHGDLWHGNVGATPAREPIIFDPALYFGDRETDVAMTKLFGGFCDAFYRAYDAEWPRAPGHGVRATLYNWYHALNHLNIFGPSYLSQAERMLTALLSELR